MPLLSRAYCHYHFHYHLFYAYSQMTLDIRAIIYYARTFRDAGCVDYYASATAPYAIIYAFAVMAD